MVVPDSDTSHASSTSSRSAVPHFKRSANMKSSLLLAFAACMGCCLRGATLGLLDPSTLPPVPLTPSGAHYDLYSFPNTLLPGNPANPIVSLHVSYDASSAPLGYHEILDTAFLFSYGIVTELGSTARIYEARVDFSPGATDVSDPFSPAFAVLHGPVPGLTDLLWTATYLDDSTASFRDGIIPEPSAFMLTSVSILGLLSFRIRQGLASRVKCNRRSL